MRTLKLLLLALILVALVVLAVANRDVVVLNLLPQGLDRVMRLSVRLPLFVVILGPALFTLLDLFSSD